MCNFAAYVGNHKAAPLLLDMIRRQEGFAGGYYTGLATIHEGKIYYAKITGDTRYLLEHTNAADLPGTIGIVHSRSRSGGGDSWAHPFIGCDTEGKEIAAYVAKGSVGYFKNRMAEFCALADELLAQGYTLPSRLVIDSDKYPAIHTGERVHMSDVMCQLITRNLVNGQEMRTAMEQAFCDMPSEIVGLTIALSQPDRVAFARINEAIRISFAPHGAYVTSNAFGIPSDAHSTMTPPPCSAGYICCDHAQVYPFKEQPCTVTTADDCVKAQMMEKALKILSDGPMLHTEVRKKLIPLFGEAQSVTSQQTTYEMVESLVKAGKIEITTRTMPGAREGLTAEKIVLQLAK